MPRKATAENSMATTHPQLAAEFHPTRNGDLTPETLLAGTNKKLWWKCPVADDHEWQATGNTRASGVGCPVCAGKKVVLSNSMATTHPELAAEFHPTKNGDLTPQTVFAGTGKKLWWKCPVADDHEWQATGNNRASGQGCSVCRGRTVVLSNSMATTHPGLAAEFHPTRNGDLTPETVLAGTHKKLWWKCDVADDHEWQTTGATRASGRGCPICAGKKLVLSNCMAVTHPQLAAEFHPTRNGDLTPETLLAGTSQKLWWKCPVAGDHEWQAAGATRASGRGCPVCRGLTVVLSNSMATTHPELAAEFHPTKNGDLTPQTVFAGTGKKLWWKCPVADDHEWQAAGATRASGVGCSVCAGRTVVLSNSMATTHPELAAEFHPTKNGDLTPETVLAGTHTKLWWKCPVADDHEWQAAGHDRTAGVGCPICSSRWTVESVRLFVKGLLDSGLYQSLDPAEMWVLFQQNGLRADHDSKRAEFVKALGTGRLDADDLNAFVDGQESPIDDLISGAGDATSLLESETVDETDLATDEVDLAETPAAGVDLDSVDGGLPVLSVSDALDALESSVWASADIEAVEFLEASAVRKMWRHAYDPEHLAAALDQSAEPREHEASERPRSRFQ